MTTIKAFIKSHPMLTYFDLTFAISWGGILVVVVLYPRRGRFWWNDSHQREIQETASVRN